MFERFNIYPGLVFEYPTPNLSNIQLQTYIYWSLVGGYIGGYAGGSAPQRRDSHYITSSVHSYLRSISTCGGGRPFFYFTNHMFERFTLTSNPQLGLVFEYRGFRPPTTGSSYTSHNIRRPFLPSVHIDGGGGESRQVEWRSWPSLFILLIYHVREIYALMHTTPVLGFQYSLELLFSNLHFYGPDGPDGPYALLPPHESPSILTLFASPVYSYGGDATLHTFFMIRPFSLYSNKIETHSSLSYLLHQSCL